MYFFILFRRHFIQSGGPVRIARYPPRCIFPRAYLSCPVLSCPVLASCVLTSLLPSSPGPLSHTSSSSTSTSLPLSLKLPRSANSSWTSRLISSFPSVLLAKPTLPTLPCLAITWLQSSSPHRYFARLPFSHSPTLALLVFPLTRHWPRPRAAHRTETEASRAAGLFCCRINISQPAAHRASTTNAPKVFSAFY